MCRLAKLFGRLHGYMKYGELAWDGWGSSGVVRCTRNSSTNESVKEVFVKGKWCRRIEVTIGVIGTPMTGGMDLGTEVKG